jgi:hypothetical protein
MEDRRRLPSPLTPTDYGSGGEFCSGLTDSSGGSLNAATAGDRTNGCYTNGLLLADCGSSGHSSDIEPPPPLPGGRGDDQDKEFIDDNDDDDDDDNMNDDDEVRLVVVEQMTSTSAMTAAVKRFSGSNFSGECGPPLERWSPSGGACGGMIEQAAAAPANVTAAAALVVHKRETVVSVDGCSTRASTARVNFAPGSEPSVGTTCCVLYSFTHIFLLQS